MPKKAKKTPKIAVLSDSDDDKDDFKNLKKKGQKFALSDSDDDDLSSPKPSTSKGKIFGVLQLFRKVVHLEMTTYQFHEFFPCLAILQKTRQIKADNISISRDFFRVL